MQERPNNTRFRSRRHTTLYTLIVGIMSFWGIGCSDNRTLGEPALPACSNAKTNVQPEEMVNEMTLGEPVVPDSTIKK
ncbi:hypothetical protein GYB22_11395 [bacterium]|nr:hypothetical protein [bacterium]